MTNAEVRNRILDDHGVLKERLDEIETLAANFEKGGPDVGQELRQLGVALFETFASHLAFEDAQLVPAIRTISEGGEELADRLEREHREQRELLRYLLGRLQEESRPTTLVVRELESFSTYLRLDMSHEEAMIAQKKFLDA